MTKLLKIDIIHTENISIEGNDYTVRISVGPNEQEFKIHVTNDSTGKNQIYIISKDAAEGLKHYQGEEFKDELPRIIKKDIENGNI